MIQIGNIFSKASLWINYPMERKKRIVLYIYYKLRFVLDEKMSHFVFDKAANQDADLPMTLGPALEHSNEYRACSVPLMRILVRSALVGNPAVDGFVDVGCGKGKACIYAKKYFRFQRITGIDFSENLLEIARRNSSIAGFDDIEWQYGDARTWMLPERKSIVFMYNPFGEVVMESFIKNNINHFRRFGSTIVYINALQSKVLLKHGFVLSGRSVSENNAIFEFGARNENQ